MTTMPNSLDSSLASCLLAAPGWARVGLTAPNERLREAAAAELVHTVVAALEGSLPLYDARQLALPL
jgi:hypothetical protein